MKLSVLLLLVISFSVFAQDHSTKANQEKNKTSKVENVLKGEKKERRKKKVEICHECGKPEEKCDCDH